MELGVKDHCAGEGQQEVRSQSVVLKLRCKKSRTHTETPTTSLVEVEAPDLNTKKV
jgi:hypothetical protein